MKKDTCTCRTCGEKKLEPNYFSITINYASKNLIIDELEGYKCASCSAELVLTDQIKRNDLKVIDAKRAFKGMLTSKEIKAARRTLNLSQEQASAVFGGGANAFSKYERGEVIQSEAMDKLIKSVLMHPSLIDIFVPSSNRNASILGFSFESHDSFISKIINYDQPSRSIFDFKLERPNKDCNYDIDSTVNSKDLGVSSNDRALAA